MQLAGRLPHVSVRDAHRALLYLHAWHDACTKVEVEVKGILGDQATSQQLFDVIRPMCQLWLYALDDLVLPAVEANMQSHVASTGVRSFKSAPDVVSAAYRDAFVEPGT